MKKMWIVLATVLFITVLLLIGCGQERIRVIVALKGNLNITDYKDNAKDIAIVVVKNTDEKKNVVFRNEYFWGVTKSGDTVEIKMLKYGRDGWGNYDLTAYSDNTDVVLAGGGEGILFLRLYCKPEELDRIIFDDRQSTNFVIKPELVTQEMWDKILREHYGKGR